MSPKSTVKPPSVEDNAPLINESRHGLTRHQIMMAGGMAVIATAALMGGVKYFNREPVPCESSVAIDPGELSNTGNQITLPDGSRAIFSVYSTRELAGKAKPTIEVSLGSGLFDAIYKTIVISGSPGPEAFFQVDKQHQLQVNATSSEVTTRCVEVPKQSNIAQ